MPVEQLTSYDLSAPWAGTTQIRATDYQCAYCGNQIGTRLGYQTSGNDPAIIALCSRCNQPTYFRRRESGGVPSARPGHPVEKCPVDLRDLYDEARNAAGAGAYTASVMISRKLLMNIAVNEGEKTGKSFADYVNYLSSNGYVSPKMKDFVDYIRTLGNEANHEIHKRDKEEAEAAIEFVGAILRHNYELPAKLPAKLNPNQSGPSTN